MILFQVHFGLELEVYYTVKPLFSNHWKENLYTVFKPEAVFMGLLEKMS